jgi:hypothetical protein
MTGRRAVDGDGGPAGDGVVARLRVAHLLPPAGRVGRATLGRWRVDEAAAREADALQASWDPGAHGRPAPPGEYAVLLVDGAFSMCDAPLMLRNYVPFVEAAHGDVLLTGLGLGCLVRALVLSPRVRTVTVLELHRDVLELVGAHHRWPGVELVHADALTWRPPPGRRFDAAMLDLADDRALVERLLGWHGPHVDRLWPDPAAMDDGPMPPGLTELVARAAAAAAP